jgi:hypothetical protein
VLGRAVYMEPSQKGCLSIAADWLHTCLNEHENCNPLTHFKKPLPTRVIQVGDETNPPQADDN